MATKNASKSTIRKTADNIKKQTKNINNSAIELTDSLVEGSIASGAKWQNIFAKAMKNGTTLFGKQQDLVLDTLEAVKGQYIDGGMRFVKLVEMDKINFTKASKAIKETLDLDTVLKTATKTVKNVLGASPKAKKAIKATASKVAKKATSKKVSIESLLEDKKTTVKKVAKPTAKKAVKKVAKKTTKTVAKAKKVVKPTAKKVTAKKASVKKVVKPTAKRATGKVTKNDLKAIEGIGPKIEGLLNKAGILTYKQLSTTKVQDLKNILTAAGPRYKMHNPTTWKKQARLAASAKWDALIELQATLKGGK